MTKLILERYKDKNIIVTFANTGCEHPATLDFVRDCDEHFAFKTVWLEAVVYHNKRKGVGFKVVDYKTASRNGEPFEEYIKKYGIPNKAMPGCTDKLKVKPMEAYLYTQNFRRNALINYRTAIGIRSDEIDRCSSKAKEQLLWYPLVELGYRKEDVLREYYSWPFRLNLLGEHYGNCTWCWKKSDRKLMTLAQDSPEVFDFPNRMENKYKHLKTDTEGGRLFFRGHRSVQDIFDASKEPFEKYSDNVNRFTDLDIGGSCGSSCEPYADQ